ncbi:MAG: hypothetical protein RL220_1540 [Bacteroidota bacterium]
MALMSLVFPAFGQTFQTLITGDDSFSGLSSRKFDTRELASRSADRIYSELITEGYLNATLDTSWSGQTLNIRIERGKRYSLVVRTVDSLQFANQLSSSDFGDVGRTAEQLISKEENNGYPFASVNPAVEYVADSVFYCDLELNRGPFFSMDSLIIRGDGKHGGNYLRHYLRFRKGMPYDESWFRSLAAKTAEIPFVRLTKPPEVLFRKGKASFYLYTEKKNANFFSGILGIQPNEATGKTNITGDLELNLVNSVNGGEEFYLNWRKLQPQTQDLKLRLLIPYIAGLPLGTEGNLEVFRRDSSFTQLKTSLALMHFLGGPQHVKVFVEKNAFNQLNNFSTAGVLANINSTMYGVAIKLEKLDYRLNPLKGWSLSLEGAAGRKDARPGGSESVTTAYEQYRINLSAEGYIKTFKRQTIRLGFGGGMLESPVIYTNEMYRIGGIRTLRGFDEESIFASSYGVASIEYRILLDRNSNLLFFGDQAWYERRDPSGFTTDTPIGFGAGVNFETRAGIFTFTYGLGSQFDNPILIRNGKIGFGFRNTF